MKYFGLSYYPELYPAKDREAYMAQDIEWLKAANVNVVRMGEFSWYQMEPSEGDYQLDWMEDTINRLGENGILTVFGTPTACPPVWMCRKYPSILYVDNQGVRRSYGGRRYSCVNDPDFRRLTAGICNAIGRRFGQNPYVLGFQVDNELGGEHNGRCQCPTCREKFRQSLRERFHDDIEALNEAFGMDNWSQHFTSFEEVDAPASARKLDFSDNTGWLGTSNPALRLAFDHFSSHSQVEYFCFQRDILQKYTQKPITTNTTHFAVNAIDYYDLAKECSLMAVDHYQNPLEEEKVKSGMIYAMTRGYQQKDFWLLETLCGGGHGNWAYEGMAHLPPQAFRQNMAYAFISGAELVTAFKFQVFAGGFEQLGSAVFDLDRIPGRRYEELCQAGADLKQMTPLLESTTLTGDVAIVLDYSSLWGHLIKPINKAFSYTAYVQALHGQLADMGVNVDIIGSDQDLDRYKLVVIPFAPILTHDFDKRLRQYVQNGGQAAAICLPFSRNEYGNGDYGMMPLGMTDVFGVRMVEAEPVWPERTPAKVSVGGMTVDALYWKEVLELRGAEAIGVFADTYRKGLPVMTENTFGAGRAIYLGTAPAARDAHDFWAWLFGRCGIVRAPICGPHGVSVVKRENGKAAYYFTFNSFEKDVEVKLADTFVIDTTGETAKESLTIPAKGLVILRKDKE